MCCMQSCDKEQHVCGHKCVVCRVVIKSRVFVDIMCCMQSCDKVDVMCCMQSGDKEQHVCGHNVLYAEL